VDFLTEVLYFWVADIQNWWKSEGKSFVLDKASQRRGFYEWKAKHANKTNTGFCKYLKKNGEPSNYMYMKILFRILKTKFPPKTKKY
jgi:hypothetical protein